MSPLTILFVIVFVDAVRGQCYGSPQLLPLGDRYDYHFVSWSDYDMETQRRANCTWDFGLPSTPYTSMVLISRIIMNCTSYYEFRINGEKPELDKWNGEYGEIYKTISTCRTRRRGSPQDQVPKRIRITLRPIINAPAAGANCPFNSIFSSIWLELLLPCPETATKMWDTTGKLDLPTTTNTIGTHLAAALGGGLVLIIIAGISLKVYRNFSQGKKRTTPQNHARQVPRYHNQPTGFNETGYDNVPFSSTPRILASGESHQYDAVAEGHEYLQLAETPGYQTVRRSGSYVEVNPIIRADTFCLKESSGYEKVHFPSDHSIRRTPSYVEVNPVGERATGGLIQKHLYDPVAWEAMSQNEAS